MAAYFCCLRCCWNGTNFSSGHVRLKELPSVQLDTTNMGTEVVVVKNGKRICGTGAAFSNVPIAQDKAYFEIKIQSTGVWGVGLATRKCNVNKVPLGDTEESWVIRNDGKLFHKNEETGKLPEGPQEGDVLGLTYDHVELNFLVNGKPTNSPMRGIKGTVYPIFYGTKLLVIQNGPNSCTTDNTILEVDEGAVLDVQFTGFHHPPTDGYDSIMVEQSLL